MPSWCEGLRLFFRRQVLGGCCGQATVEAAFLVPLLLVGLMLLIQPGIVLYDRMVMNAAASEGCRLLTTMSGTDYAARLEEAIRRGLAAIPQQENFHMHDPCSWEVFLEGGAGSRASVTIRNKVRPLPLFDWGASALGVLDSEGLMSIEVKSEARGWPDWVSGSSEGLTPRGWIDSWDGS